MINKYLFLLVLALFCFRFAASAQRYEKKRSIRSKIDTSYIYPDIKNIQVDRIDDCEKKRSELQIQINHEIASKYSETCEQRSLTPAIGYISWEIVKMYWDVVPILKVGRNNFDVASNKLRDFIDDKIKTDSVVYLASIYKQDEEFDSWKGRLYNVLDKRYQSDYRNLRREVDEALGISNRESLTYIIDDYHKKGKLMPVNWIPGYLNIIRSDSCISRLCSELKSIDELCVKSTKQKEIIDYSTKYSLPIDLKKKGYSVLYVSDKKDVVVLKRRDQKNVFKVGEMCEFDVILNRDKDRKYNITLKPGGRSDGSGQYHNIAVIWTSGISLVTIGALPSTDRNSKPTACIADKMFIYIGQSKTDNPCCKPFFWDDLEEFEFYYPITWQ